MYDLSMPTIGNHKGLLDFKGESTLPTPDFMYIQYIMVF